MNRRSYALSLIACLAGAAIALYAVTRTWSLEVAPRTGMSDLRTARTGADVAPWVVGLALVGLAGTGALLATRGRLRRGLGGLLTLVGLGIAAGAVAGRAGLDVGRAGAAGTFWPVACAVGGAIVALGGLTAARHGHRWPVMSTRYERSPVPPPRSETSGGSVAAGGFAQAGSGSAGGSRSAAAPGRAGGAGSGPAPLEPADHRATWDAIDRGDDPTT